MTETKQTITLLDRIGFLKVSGKDAATFLQGQMTNDFMLLNEEISQPGACCNLQGRVISFFRAFCFEEAIYLRMPGSVIDKTIEHLKKFAMFSKVELSNASDEWVCAGIIANEPLDLFASQPLAVDQLTHYKDYLITRVPDTTKHRYELYFPKTIFDKTWAELSNHFHLTEETNWQLSQINNGLPEIVLDTSEKFTAHDLNLHELSAISFNKGCYQGQEIIARMHYRAKLKQHLRLALVHEEKTITPGEKLISEERTAGEVVQSLANKGQTYLLAVVKDKAVDVGISLASGEKLIFL